MLIKHFFINKIALSSYILAGSKVCAIIDPQRDIEISIKEATALICSSGNRSSLDVSILSQDGFKNLFNVAGGMTGYNAAGHSKNFKIGEKPSDFKDDSKTKKEKSNSKK